MGDGFFGVGIPTRQVYTAAETLTAAVGLVVREATSSTVEIADGGVTQADTQALADIAGILIAGGSSGDRVTVACRGGFVRAKIGTGGCDLNQPLVAENGTGKLIVPTSISAGDTIVAYAMEAASADTEGLVWIALQEVYPTALTSPVLTAASAGGSLTIDMEDAGVSLTGAQVAANAVFLVDPNSGGASEALTLPTGTDICATALATGVSRDITIVNTGGEGIVLTANTGCALQTNPASGGATIAAGLAATIRLTKVGTNSVRALITQHLTPA